MNVLQNRAQEKLKKKDYNVFAEKIILLKNRRIIWKRAIQLQFLNHISGKVQTVLYDA